MGVPHQGRCVDQTRRTDVTMLVMFVLSVLSRHRMHHEYHCIVCGEGVDIQVLHGPTIVKA